MQTLNMNMNGTPTPVDATQAHLLALTMAANTVPVRLGQLVSRLRHMRSNLDERRSATQMPRHCVIIGRLPFHALLLPAALRALEAARLVAPTAVEALDAHCLAHLHSQNTIINTFGSARR